MANELDDLMSLDPLDLTREDIGALIARYRGNRARSGEKPKKEEGPKLKLDLVQLGLVPKVAPIKRRI